MEHAYWGGARDRIPASQTDAMEPRASRRSCATARCCACCRTSNLCLIRSGQDWGDTEADERACICEDVEPVLRAGMDFLRDDGRGDRLLRQSLHARGDARRPADREELRHELVEEPGGAGALGRVTPDARGDFRRRDEVPVDARPGSQTKLYHEVTVARADEQLFEYLNCHARTGMLRAGWYGPRGRGRGPIYDRSRWTTCP